MSRFLIPILFITLGIGSFFLYTQPIYDEAIVIRDDVTKLQDARDKLDLVLQKKQELINKYNSLQQTDIDRLEKLMPDNLDNIKLIIDIDNLSRKYGLILNAVKFDVDQRQATGQPNGITGQTGTVQDNRSAVANTKDYNSFGFSLTMTGNFENLNKLLADVEKNLRIVDISSITFDASDTRDTYKYEIKAKIYWLKDVAKLTI